jgi:hypothetical protein
MSETAQSYMLLIILRSSKLPGFGGLWLIGTWRSMGPGIYRFVTGGIGRFLCYVCLFPSSAQSLTSLPLLRSEVARVWPFRRREQTAVDKHSCLSSARRALHRLLTFFSELIPPSTTDSPSFWPFTAAGLYILCGDLSGEPLPGRAIPNPP